MARYERNMLLLSKVETTAGTDAAPAAGTDAVLIVDKVDITPVELNLVQRNLIQAYFGASPDLAGTAYSKVSFSCECAGSGTAGTSAEWGDILLGCATASASLTAPVRIEHTPVSTSLKTLTHYLYDDGVLHKLLYAFGNAKLTWKHGETPKWQFEYLAQYMDPTASTTSGISYANWKQPLPINKTNVSKDITLGGTYSAGAITGGTTFASFGFELDFGNKTSFFASCSSERPELSDRDSKLSFEIEPSASEEVSMTTATVGNTATSFAMQLGSAAGAKLLVYCPNIHRTAIKKGNREGVRTLQIDAKVCPSSGNDEFRIVQL